MIDISDMFKHLTISLFPLDFKMTVVEAYFGGKKMDSPDNAQSLSVNVTSLIVEGIAQNTSGSIFEPEVSMPFVKKAKTHHMHPMLPSYTV
jgi:hypothetical protein